MVAICNEAGQEVSEGICGWGRIRASDERYVQTPSVLRQFRLFFLRVLLVQFRPGLAGVAGAQVLGLERMLGGPCFRPLHGAADSGGREDQ